MNFAVYCGSSKGHLPIYTKSAKELAKVMVDNNINMVYGGGNIGLMGVMADEVMNLGGKVYGVIPKILAEKEVAHYGITELFIVNNMHERKAKMFELSNAIIALPGGIGTMEELFEALTWNQIGIHHKPCGILDTNNYYKYFEIFLEHMVNEGFLRTTHKNLLKFSTNASELVEMLIKKISK
ncbi:MAG: TIGR00730 family Rossman fold protein [Bacteroidia bacterium]